MNQFSRKNMPKALRLMVYAKCGGRCAYCGEKLELKDMQVDHLESVYMAGRQNDDIGNLMPSCRKCNWSKHAMGVEGLRREIRTYLRSLNRYNHDYQMAKKYGLVKETGEKIEFWFEKAGKKEG